jgi:hypothetical protein
VEEVADLILEEVEERVDYLLLFLVDLKKNYQKELLIQLQLEEVEHLEFLPKEQVELLVLLQMHNQQSHQLVEVVVELKQEVIGTEIQVDQGVELVLQVMDQEQVDQVLLVKEIMVVIQMDNLLVVYLQEVEVEQAP